MMKKVKKVEKIYNFPRKQIKKEWWVIEKSDGKIIYIPIDNVDEMLRKTFGKHGNLYKKITNIPDEILEIFHPNDDEFGISCEGFEKFIKYCICDTNSYDVIVDKITDLLAKNSKINVKTREKILKEFEIED